MSARPREGLPRPAPLLVIAGPTASGKSALGLHLAAELGGEIVSCDSVAVYRGCDIGAAKPSPEERARVPHHLLDVAQPNERFSAADFVAAADAAIASITERGRPVLVVGGTGLYLHALIDGLFPSPPPDPALRERLHAEGAALGWPALHARLAEVDPAAASRIAPTDPVRIERALEVYQQTGVPISELQARHRAAGPRYPTLALLLDPGVEELDRRIAVRTAHLVERGLVAETAALVARYGRDLKPLGAVGYKEALAFLEGTLPASDLESAIRRSTRHFARRQRTWLARYEAHRERVCHLRGGEELALAPIRAFLSEAGHPSARP